MVSVIKFNPVQTYQKGLNKKADDSTRQEDASTGGKYDTVDIAR